MAEEYVNLGRLFEQATSNKVYLNGSNLHEIENNFFLNHTVDFEMIGSMLIREIEQRTNISSRNVEDFEIYIHAIDVDHESEDFMFTGWVYKLNAPQFNIVKRSQYGSGTDFKQDISDSTGNSCYIPTSGNYFIKCNNLINR